MLQRFEQINKEILLVIFVENAWHVENLIDQYPVLPTALRCSSALKNDRGLLQHVRCL